MTQNLASGHYVKHDAILLVKLQSGQMFESGAEKSN